MKIVPEFVKDATNVYRTKNFIVKQVLGIKYGEVQNNEVVSQDTFYVRTAKRDWQYNNYFSFKVHINGKRLPSTMYSRKYVQ